MSKSKSRPTIPPKTKTLLWLKSAGRCQFDNCNKPLWKHDVTMAKMNKAYIAHIYAYSPNGPRYHESLSKELEVAFENLMLVCDECHRIFDDKQRVNEYPAERLIKMKGDHEDRIERLTAIHPSKKSHILLYGATINDQISPLSYHEAVNTITPDFYPDDDKGTIINLKQNTSQDDTESYWQFEANHLETQILRLLEFYRCHSETVHFSVFALAPIPLLIKLGSVLTDITNCHVYQLSREPRTWQRQSSKDFKGHFFKEPENRGSEIALKIELSAKIDDSRVREVLGDDCEIWSISHSKPHNDYLKSTDQLENFRQVMRQVYAELRKLNDSRKVIHVFPAMPISTAVELGRIRSPKADLQLMIYDQNNKKKRFIKALEIC